MLLKQAGINAIREGHSSYAPNAEVSGLLYTHADKECGKTKYYSGSACKLFPGDEISGTVVKKFGNRLASHIYMTARFSGHARSSLPRLSSLYVSLSLKIGRDGCISLFQKVVTTSISLIQGG